MSCPQTHGLYGAHDRIDAPLYVVTAITNPVRFRSRWKLYERFAKVASDAGARLVTIEAAFGERRHVLPDVPHGTHISLRTRHEVWHKENLLNLAIQQLPSDWKYVAWVDADVDFARPTWVTETVHQLQHYDFVQLFSEAVDLSPDYEIIGAHRSFAWCWQHMPELFEKTADSSYYYGGGSARGKGGAHLLHPGFAWAARRDALDAVGGLIDWGILGSGDMHMARALVGQGVRSLHPEIGGAYRRWLGEWEARCETHVRRNLGYVSGLLTHGFHGKKRDRRYGSRWRILIDSGFDPERDLKRDTQGMWQLTERNQELRDGIRAYLRSRAEDSIDI